MQRLSREVLTRVHANMYRTVRAARGHRLGVPHARNRQPHVRIVRILSVLHSQHDATTSHCLNLLLDVCMPPTSLAGSPPLCSRCSNASTSAVEPNSNDSFYRSRKTNAGGWQRLAVKACFFAPTSACTRSKTRRRRCAPRSLRHRAKNIAKEGAVVFLQLLH